MSVQRLTRRQALAWACTVGLSTAAGAAALAACGPTSTPTPTSKPALAPTAPAVAPVATAAPPAAATVGVVAPPTAKPAAQAAQRGGVFRMQDIGIEHLDSSITTTNQLMRVVEASYERLFHFRASTYDDVGLLPALAENYDVSADGKTWTLKVRQGVQWHNVAPVNGREFTSADVAWNVNYYKTSSAFQNLWQPVTAVETPDKYTVVLKLDEPLAPFLALMGNQYNRMYPREVFDRDGNFRKTLIGTGPFVFKSITDGVNVQFERNPSYWDVSEIDGRPLPYADAFQSITVKDYATRVAQLRAGQTEHFYPPLNEADQKGLAQSNPEIQLLVTNNPSAHGIMMNVSVPPWNDVRLRKALSKAIDRQAYIDLLFGAGRGVWNVYIPLSEYAWSDAERRERFKFDPDGARALLREAGYRGEPLVWTGYPGGSVMNTPESGQIFIEMAGAVGMKLEPQWLPDSPTQRRRFEAGDWGAASWNVSFGGGDPDDWLYPFYHSSSPITANFSRVKDPELDKLIEAQRRELNADKRKTAISSAVDYIYDKMYFIPVAAQTGVQVVPPHVRDSRPHWSAGIPHLSRTWLSR